MAKKYLIMGKQAQTIELSTELGINYIPCCSIVLMCYNVWLYVFGFATHILPFKAIQPICKTDIYNVLALVRIINR